jgi:hypothetical protein
VDLKLTNLAEEMHRQIEADERRIRFENLRNLNSLAVPSLVLGMKERRTEEFAQQVYDLYCDVWQTQGHAKSAAFLRTVFRRGILPHSEPEAGRLRMNLLGSWGVRIFLAKSALPTWKVFEPECTGLRIVGGNELRPKQ